MSIRERILWLLATCAGFGCSPILPGTCGALWGIPIYLAIVLGTPGAWHTPLIAAALVASSAVTVAISDWAEKYFGEEDSGHFVTDEVAGFLLTILLFRPAGISQTANIAWAFVVTRLIDIAKVPPARRLENLPGGIGVLADDLLGSLYAAGLLHLTYYFAPQLFGAAGGA